MLQKLPDSAQVHVDGLGLNDRIEIWADERDPNSGNASHHYQLRMDGKVVAAISFQHGPRDADGSTAGITEAALFAVILDRLNGFQAGPYRCRENALQITKVEEAHQWTRERAWTRHRQGVLGKNEAHV